MRQAKGLVLQLVRCNALARADERLRGLEDAPFPDLDGPILAGVQCNDPHQESEWSAWSDEVHMPDRLVSGAFAGLSRSRRALRCARGANSAPLDEVGEIGVEESVARSASVMPGVVDAGRRYTPPVGGPTAMPVQP